MLNKGIIRCLFLFFTAYAGHSQVAEKDLMQKINSCVSKECKAVNAFKLSEYYLETDEIPKAQKWLDSCKIWSLEKDALIDQSAIFSLQSELFYYFGLFQFGISEAEKGIYISIKKQDSAAIADAFFFKGINLFEMKQYDLSQKALKNADRFYPSSIKRKYLRNLIKPEHIYNNLGQLKLQLQQWDSASYYNSKAYKIALSQKSGRAIANCEQTFGLIKLGKTERDSAVYYLKRSKETALHYKYYDLAMLDEGFLMQAMLPEKDSVVNHFKQGTNLLESYPVNTLFKRQFYKEAVSVFDALQMEKETIALQKKLLQIEDSIRLKGNLLVQDISQQYIETEKELFNVQRNEFKKQEKVNFLNLLALLLITILLVVVVLLFRRKNKEQKKLLQQKTEISNDLHDDIGSNLTSIMIHAQMLERQETLSTEQKRTLSKISATGSEISQRLNTFIWILNEEHDNLQDFLEYIKHYASNLFEDTTIKVHYHQAEAKYSEINVSGQVRKNVFYCVKELLANVLKHTEATEVSIAIRFNEKRILQISIEDNGKGLQGSQHFGNGLVNIEKRMKAHKGAFRYTSEKGFKAMLLLPL